MNEVEELSKSWAKSTIEESCDIWSGYGFPERLQGRPHGEIPFFKVGDISEAWKRNDVHLIHAKHYVTADEMCELRATPFPAETTVFAKIGAAIGLNRRAMLAIPSLVDNNVMGLSAKPGILDPKYLFYFVCTLKLMELAKATTVPSVRKTEIAPIIIPVAPLEEQQRIASEVEKQFTRLDDAVVALKRVQANLKRYRASVLKAACEGRLVPTEAELARKEGRDYEPASELLKRILTERRDKWEADQLQKMIAAGKRPKNNDWKQKYKQPEPPDTSNLPQLPEAWAWASPAQIAAEEEYALAIGPFGSNLKVSDYTDSGVPLVFVKNIRSGDFSDEASRFISHRKAVELKPHIVKAGDLLITKMGDPPGDACIYPVTRPPAVITADCIKLRLHPTLQTRYFFITAIMSNVVRKQILSRTKGVAQLKISLARLKSIAIPLPPSTEQARIAADVERRMFLAQRALDELEKKIAKSTQLKQSILRQAFEGKLVPQNPTDEPASVLLERIRTERATASANRNGSQQITMFDGITKPQRRRRGQRLAQPVRVGNGGSGNT